jgi:hypothetical protein
MKNLINITKKAGLVVLVLLLISSVSTPEKEVHKIIKILKSGKTQKIEKYYLEKSEFIDMVNHMDPKPSQEQIDGLLEGYEASKENYLKGFEDTAIENWSNIEIDRMEYDYKIGKPGQDEEIQWPKSKDYQAVYKNTEMTKVKFFIFLKDKDEKYMMRMEMMNYKGKWKLSHMLKPLYVQKIDKE